MIKYLLNILMLIITAVSWGQFAPQAGLPGSTALPASSPLFKAWATNAYVQRGYILLEDTTFCINGSNHAYYGKTENIFSKPDNHVISLGDKGCATIILDNVLYDGPGWDFAIFENGFRDNNDSSLAFLELAFVNVSSNGKDFFTFPSISLTEDTLQKNGFDMLDAKKIHNLAGKYIAGYGVPFDLHDMQQYSSQGLDLNNIRFIRICDVGGSINPLLASYDWQGHIINDPYPTPYPTGGFDLDAVGLINIKSSARVKIYPNPSYDVFFISSPFIVKQLIIIDLQGRLILKSNPNVKFIKINLSNFKSGLYFCILKGNNYDKTVKLILL